MARERAIQAWLHRGASQARGLSTVRWNAPEVMMKTQGEIEAAICKWMSRFEQEFTGRGPKDILAHLID